MVQTICFFPNPLPFPSESVPENVDFVNVLYGHATVSVIILFQRLTSDLVNPDRRGNPERLLEKSLN